MHVFPSTDNTNLHLKILPTKSQNNPIKFTNQKRIRHRCRPIVNSHWRLSRCSPIVCFMLLFFHFVSLYVQCSCTWRTMCQRWQLLQARPEYAIDFTAAIFSIVQVNQSKTKKKDFLTAYSWISCSLQSYFLTSFTLTFCRGEYYLKKIFYLQIYAKRRTAWDFRCKKKSN